MEEVLNRIVNLAWLARYGHVAAAALWFSSYAGLVLVLMPLVRRAPTVEVLRTTLTAVRVGTYAGTATIIFGVLLVTRTRGFASLTPGGEWGLIILMCIVLAVLLLGIGDGALRPALRRVAAGGSPKAAERWIGVGFVIVILAIGLMTRALYAKTTW